jgi:hypothetical protein
MKMMKKKKQLQFVITCDMNNAEYLTYYLGTATKAKKERRNEPIL